MPRRRAILAPTIVAALLVPLAVIPSSAAWTDTEHTNGAVAAIDCQTTSGFRSAGGGQLLSGTLLGTDLAGIADVAGVDVAATSEQTTVSPSTADPLAGVDGSGTPVNSGAFGNPLRVEALGAITLDLGNVLVLPLDAEAGVLGQYGRALPDGYSAGAAGAVSNSGAVDLDPPAPGAELPRIATLELGQVLTSVLGSTGTGVADLADVRLGVGAVASSAVLDGCDALWSRDLYAALEREYLVAGLEAELDSPLVGGLVGTVESTLTALDTTLEEVAGSSGLVNSLFVGLGPVLNPLLTGLAPGTPLGTVELDADFTAVRTLLSTPIGDAGGLLEIDLAGGTVSIDLARLLGPNYQDSVGLNGLAPNTELVLNAAAVNALTTALTGALDQWAADVLVAVNQALAVVTADVDLSVPLSALGLLDIATLTVSVDASLASLLGGSAVVSVAVDRAAGLCSIAIVGGALCSLVNGLVAGLTGAVTTSLGPLIGGVLRTALAPTTSIVATLGTTLNGLLAPVVTLVASSLNVLFGPDSVLSLVVNAQNRPDPARQSVPAGDPPAWAASLPAPDASARSSGRFDVSALRLVVLGGLGGGVALDLARSSVGPNQLPR